MMIPPYMVYDFRKEVLMFHYISPLQLVTVMLACFTLLTSAKRIRFNKCKISLRLPVIFLMLHTIFFYTLSFYNSAVPNSFIHGHLTIWSSILRFHALTTFSVLEFYGYERDKLLWNQLQRPR